MQRSYHEEISEKKAITGSDNSENSYCTSRNVIQDNGNMNNFSKGSRWFCRQFLGTFLTTRIKKMVVWKTTSVSEHLNTNQS